MLDTRRQCQQVANGWRGQLKIAVDIIVKPQRCRQLVLDFYRQFPDVELLVQPEVFNGVWDALVDGRADMAIGATRAVPVGGGFAFRDMGDMRWLCVASPQHPLAGLDGLLNDDQLRPFLRCVWRIRHAICPSGSPDAGQSTAAGGAGLGLCGGLPVRRIVRRHDACASGIAVGTAW